VGAACLRTSALPVGGRTSLELTLRLGPSRHVKTGGAWCEEQSHSALLEVMAVAAFVSARMILMSASLQPWLKYAGSAAISHAVPALADATVAGSAALLECGYGLGVFWDQPSRAGAASA
jgi:hypothetical protein